MHEFKIIAFLVGFLYILYDTDALPYYLRLISDKFFKISQYFTFKNTSPVTLNYLEAIAYQAKALKKESFFLNLLSCVTCISVWLVIILNFLCNLGWENVGYEIILTWIGYSFLKWILIKLNS